MKNNHLLLVLVTIISTPLLSSCSLGPFVPWDVPEVGENYVRPNASKFNEVLEYYTKSVNFNDIEQATGYYTQLQEYLNYVLDLRESVSLRKQNISEDKVGEELTYLYNYYWTIKSNEVATVQKALNSFFNKDTAIKSIGEENVEVYKSISLNRMFVNRKYYHYDSNHVTKHTENVIKLSTQSNKGFQLLMSLSNAALALYDLIEAYSVCTVRSNLDVTDDYYNKELTYITNLVFSSQNEYIKAMLTAITSSYRELLEEQLGKEAVESILNSSKPLDEELISIQEEETSLVSKYFTIEPNKRKELYLDLIKNRQNFLNTYNQKNQTNRFNSYSDYVYETTFNRDYTPLEVNTFLNNLSTTFKDNWTILQDKRIEIEGEVTERDLWNALSFTDNIINESESVRNHMKQYGLYSFDSNPNSYDGAFVATVSNLNYNDSFMLVNTSNNINDYTAVIHEFGHYYANMMDDGTNSTSDYSSLDLSEIYSQGLELLMMDNYNSFLKEDDADKLKETQLGNALWAIYSGSCVTEFENYAYSLSNPTVELLDQKWNELKTKYNLTNYTFSYDIIPHIYQQPCYYVSYVTSIISSLEIWSLPREDGIKTYNDLITLGSYNPYISTLQSVELSNPFSDSSLLNELNSKISSLVD